MANGKLEKFFSFFKGTGRFIGGAWAFLRLSMYVVIALCIFGTAYYIYQGGKSVASVVVKPIERITGTTPIPENLPEKVSEERLKCRAYTMLADFDGAPQRLDADKVRILKTVTAYAKVNGVDECEVFRRQMELVVPGWGRRHGSFLPMVDRHFWYIESTFSESARNAALLLAREIATKPDGTWQAIVLVRPDRPNTKGNQKPEELAKIRSMMDRFPVEGPSDFEFYKPKVK